MAYIRTHLKRGESQKAHARQMMNGFLGLVGFDPDMFAVFDVWDREVGSLVRGCEAVAIQGKKICVRVPSAVHRQELLYSKNRILSRVNQALGRTAITDVQFELDTEKRGERGNQGKR